MTPGPRCRAGSMRRSARAAFILAPLGAMITRVDWNDFLALITSDSSIAALLLSLRTSTVATILCLLAGIPLALVLSRGRGRAMNLGRSMVLLPLVLPPVVAGIALLYTFGRRGLLGASFEAFGIQIAFSTTAVVLAQTFVAMPFLVISLEARCGRSGRATRTSPRLWGRADHSPETGHPAQRRTGPRVGGRTGLRPGAGNSGPRSPSRAACKGSPGHCRWRSTCKRDRS